MNQQKTWLITGAARGLGFEITKAVLASGDKVIAAVRSKPENLANELKNDDLKVVKLDITDQAAIKTVSNRAAEEFGKIDVLLNNAGFGLLGAIEEATEKDIRDIYETNVFGTLNMIRGILPLLRKQRSGHIINMSSVGGLTGSAGWGLYNSTKFAVEGFSEALSKELAPLNIRVTIVEPGYFRTNFLDQTSLNTIGNVIDDYAETAGKTRSTAAGVNKKQPGDPQKLAAALIKTVQSDKPPLHLIMGKDSLYAYLTKISNFANDIDDWKDTIIGTDHD